MDKTILDALKKNNDNALHLLERFVQIESYSHDKEGVDRLGKDIIDVFSDAFPVKTERIMEVEQGDHLRIQLGHGGKKILLLSHLDTVYPKGTLKQMPFWINEGKAMGPGVLDIKQSYVMVYHLFQLLLQHNSHDLNKVKIVWLLTSDEEIGSPTGQHVVLAEAQQSEAVLVLEPATNDGKLKSARKGGGNFSLEVLGISAHAGLNPQDGANAIEELAYQITQIVKLADHSRGTTINTGEIRGGDLFNVVPAYASTKIDVRILEPDEGIRVERAFKNLQVKNQRTQLKIHGSVYRPPLLKTEQTFKLLSLAQKVADDLELKIEDTLVGGGSDGNYAAQTGIPVLDGLGAYGGFAHAPEEYVWVDSIAERSTLVYGILRELLKNSA
ncbi:M20 family metallopeptidase [Caldalkalibacillus salinus]|uniref:M20 family metallopeptidase n=1 Tax=Caldalkalibacillus salinus TaxID=2803787 RepID=UPI0019223162|nr:M20 family metallopeptidase [Caldalkalibacillus salinus]